ncbi:MAG: hypothetical protein VX589_20310, partial [Myxococcota bacterium]|nr:hypothetical protein [Myxococcota bacterium]
MDQIELNRQLDELKTSQERAIELSRRIELSKAYGNLEGRVSTFFVTHRLIADLNPAVWRWTSQGNVAKALKVALGKAKSRFETVHRESAAMRTDADKLLEEARFIADNRTTKRTHKEKAIELIRADPVASKDLRSWRTSHMPSARLITALQKIQPPSRQSNQTIAALQPWASRRELKAKINAFLGSQRAALPDFRPRTRVRVDHAPMSALIQMLEDIVHALDDISSSEKLQAKTDEIDTFVEQLDTRVQLANERKNLIERAHALEKTLGAEKKEARAALKKLTAVIAAENEQRRILIEDIAQRNADRNAALQELHPHEVQALELQDQYDRLLAIDCEMGVDRLKAERQRIDALQAPDSAGVEQLRRDLEQARSAQAEKQAELDLQTAEQEELQAALDASSGEARSKAQADLQSKEAQVRATTGALAQARTQFTRADDAYATAFDASMQKAILGRVYGSLDRRAFTSDEQAEIQLENTVDVVRIDVLRAKETALGHCVIYRERVRAKEEAHHSAMAALTALEALLFDNVAKQAYLISSIHRIDDALTEAKAQWALLADTETLIFYVKLSENIYEQCLKIAKVVKGGYTGADAMGRLKLVIMVEAGLRAGYDLGIVNLSATVSATIQLSGELSILDSREMAFTHHLTLFLSAHAGARASVSGADIMPDVLPESELLAEASARCSANLYDYRGIAAYQSEEHWATYWADAIARRAALIRSVKLTKNGFESLSEQWLDDELDKLAEDGASYAWIGTLTTYRKEAPRSLGLEHKGFGVEGTVTAQVGQGRARRGHAGTAPGRATYTLYDDKRQVGEVEEDSCHFVPASAQGQQAEERPEKNFLGHAVYHRFESSGRVHEFLEVRKNTAHKVTMGQFTFTSATTRNAIMATETEAAIRGRRALANALDVTPGARYTGQVALPTFMAESGGSTTPTMPGGAPPTTAAELRDLKKTIRMRIDIVESRGVRTRLEHVYQTATEAKASLDRQMQSLETRLNSIRSGVEQVTHAVDRAEQAASQATSQLPGGGGRVPTEAVAQAVRGTVQAVASQVTGAGDQVVQGYERAQTAISSKLEELQLNAEMLEKSHNTYTRWYRTRIVSLSASQASLEWTYRWTPQVYRGMTVSQYDFTLGQTVPIIPALSAFFHEKVSVEAESVRFEALGLGTFSYLKSLFNSFASAE